MALVDYSDSESEADESAANTPAVLLVDSPPSALKRKHKDERTDPTDARMHMLPPLPPTFHSLYATNVRSSTSDDPSLHGGRTRQIPHVDGQWPTHIYLEWYPSRTELNLLKCLISQLRSRSRTTGNTDSLIQSLLQSELDVQLPLHVSLSAPLVLRTDQKLFFEDRLEVAIRGINVIPFNVSFGSLEWTSNQDGSRYFLVLRLVKPEKDELGKLLQASNHCAREFDLPLLYDDGFQEKKSLHSPIGKNSFRPPPDRSQNLHISVAWQLDKPTEEEIQYVAAVDLQKLNKTKLTFDEVKLKIGNIVKSIRLGSKP